MSVSDQFLEGIIKSLVEEGKKNHGVGTGIS